MRKKEPVTEPDDITQSHKKEKRGGKKDSEVADS